jgi:RNA polymerase sigma-70 factor (ECF subfamily)
LRAGSEDAATQLYLRYARRLQQLARARCSPDLARRIDADDIVQSVFTSFFRGVVQGFYDVMTGEEAWRLLLVIALNKIRAKGNFHRAARRDVRRTAGAEALHDDGLPDPEADATALTSLRLVIDEVLAALPEDHRQIVLLRIEEYQVDEIAERTRRSRRTVERVLQDFRRRLTRVLEEEGHEGLDA